MVIRGQLKASAGVRQITGAMNLSDQSQNSLLDQTSYELYDLVTSLRPEARGVVHKWTAAEREVVRRRLGPSAILQNIC